MTETVHTTTQQQIPHQVVHDPDAVTVLGDEECWEVLAGGQLGHLAFHLAGELGLVPVNYVTDGRRLVFRTAEGSKLFGMTLDDSVVFEVDEIDDDVARTVVVRGRVRVLHGVEERAAEELPLRPWVPTLKYNLVAVEPTEVSGRRFRLVR